MNITWVKNTVFGLRLSPGLIFSITLQSSGKCSLSTWFFHSVILALGKQRQKDPQWDTSLADSTKNSFLAICKQTGRSILPSYMKGLQPEAMDADGFSCNFIQLIFLVLKEILHLSIQFYFLLSAASNQLVKEKSESVEHREADGIIPAVVL